MAKVRKILKRFVYNMIFRPDKIFKAAMYIVHMCTFTPMVSGAF